MRSEPVTSTMTKKINDTASKVAQGLMEAPPNRQNQSGHLKKNRLQALDSVGDGFS